MIAGGWLGTIYHLLGGGWEILEPAIPRYMIFMNC
jgi:hypothetical protein